jgi:hypothetical protein
MAVRSTWGSPGLVEAAVENQGVVAADVVRKVRKEHVARFASVYPEQEPRVQNGNPGQDVVLPPVRRMKMTI